MEAINAIIGTLENVLDEPEIFVTDTENGIVITGISRSGEILSAIIS